MPWRNCVSRSLLSNKIAFILTLMVTIKRQYIIWILTHQLEVCTFYRSLGFTTQGESYDDGGIEHISMFYLP